jgi:hypothetical protein
MSPQPKIYVSLMLTIDTAKRRGNFPFLMIAGLCNPLIFSLLKEKCPTKNRNEMPSKSRRHCMIHTSIISILSLTNLNILTHCIEKQSWKSQSSITFLSECHLETNKQQNLYTSGRKLLYR